MIHTLIDINPEYSNSESKNTEVELNNPKIKLEKTTINETVLYGHVLSVKDGVAFIAGLLR